jgi:hypothetical protein
MSPCEQDARIAKIEGDVADVKAKMGFAAYLDKKGEGVIEICTQTHRAVETLTRMVKWGGGIIIAVWLGMLANYLAPHPRIERDAHASEKAK